MRARGAVRQVALADSNDYGCADNWDAVADAMRRRDQALGTLAIREKLSLDALEHRATEILKHSYTEVNLPDPMAAITLPPPAPTIFGLPISPSVPESPGLKRRRNTMAD